ncbi:hypothetical protein VI06_20690 [Aquitalea magnusonii]|nr:hypothetical protein VI06_20690 [Aquitalea magnusonii]
MQLVYAIRALAKQNREIWRRLEQEDKEWRKQEREQRRIDKKHRKASNAAHREEMRRLRKLRRDNLEKR